MLLKRNYQARLESDRLTTIYKKRLEVHGTYITVWRLNLVSNVVIRKCKLTSLSEDLKIKNINRERLIMYSLATVNKTYYYEYTFTHYSYEELINKKQ